MGRSRSDAAPSGGADLPVELSSFIGRDRELDELRRLLPDSRLLTLTGAGGSGKTRLALELAHGAGRAPVAWASLAPVTDPGHLTRAVAEAYGIREEAATAGASALVPLLRGRGGLLVLDNCEHLVDACAELADTLLRGCPALSILATSREPLGVRGERAWLVPPLSLPESAFAGSSESVRLFVERAREVTPSFELTEANAAAVADVCLRLDGIPLAIELAAARVRMLAPEQLRDRLEDAFHILTSGGRTAPARHRTLRATMDWSHDLLPEDARIFFRRLAVFRGGFTLDAAEAVGSGDGIDPAQVLELLSRLVDRSLVVVREQASATRYGLLETVRQYASQRLEASEESDAVRSRHARWALERAREAEPHMTRPERPLWLGRLLPELDNLRQALHWSRERDPDLHVELVGTLWWFWFSTQHWNEARRWIDDALGTPAGQEPDPRRARLLFAGGALAVLQGRGAEARPTLEEAVELARAHGDERLQMYASAYLGMTYAGEGRPEGRELCRTAAAWFRDHDDLYGLRLSLLLLGATELFQGSVDEGERLNAEAVAVARRFGLGRELAVSLQNLAVVYLVQGDPTRAEPLLREALAASRGDPSYFTIATGLGYLGEAMGDLGRPLEAARLLGASAAARELIGARPFPRDAERQEAAIPRFRAAAGGEAFGRAHAEGRALGPMAVIDELLRHGPEPAAARGVAAPEVALMGPEPPVDRPTVDLEVKALGPLEVAVEGQMLPADAWRYAKPKELLVWLLLHRAGGTRDEIGRQLWPEADPAQLKNSFHVTMHHLRKALGKPEWIIQEESRYRLSPELDAELDAQRFEQMAAAALRDAAGVQTLHDILALHRGELLEEESVGPWLLDHRDRLRARYVDVTMALGGRLEEADDLEAAARRYYAVAVKDELNEEAHRRLMRCWAGTGERERALRWYERLAETLERELDAVPEPATVRLYESLADAV